MGTLKLIKKEVLNRRSKFSTKGSCSDKSKVINPDLFYLKPVTEEKHKQSRLDAYEYIF